MERTPVASAMDWSIHLDRALRSSNPVKRTEAIREVGARLERWNREPKLTVAEHDMLGLVPGEDELFANAILLRLADAFETGDRHTKLCVVEAFLSESRRRKTKGFDRKNQGILSRRKVVNHMELLRRVKSCFGTGDEEVRALALVLFGCWSEFAADNAEIRYLVLSSVVSSYVLEVKASLFAAGCFCELSDDFACVLLEILVNMVSSSDTPMAGRLAGVRALAKIGVSSTLASRAYEEGVKLVLDSAEDDIVKTMLISLSIVASKSALLISRQVDLLFSILSRDKALPLQETSLRCLRVILSRRRFHFRPNTELTAAVIDMLNGKLPPTMQRDALHILYEMFMSKIPSFSSSEMRACFPELLTVVVIVIRSPSLSNRLFAVRVLVDISGKLTRRTDTECDGPGKTPAAQAASFVLDRIAVLADSIPKLPQPDMETEREIRSLLKLLFCLLYECPDIGEFALRKIDVFIKHLVDKDDGVLSTGKRDPTVGKDHGTAVVSKIVVSLSKTVALCLENVVNSGALSGQAQNVTRLLVEDVCRCSYFDDYVRTLSPLLLHPHNRSRCTRNETDTDTYDPAYVIRNEILALESAKKLLAANDNWSAYKAGKYAVLQGAWFTAAFIFRELTMVVRSDSHRRWLTFLASFASSETKIQLLSSRNETFVLFDWLASNTTSGSLTGLDYRKTDKTKILRSYINDLDDVSRVLEETLGADRVMCTHPHYFHVWFSSLRARVIETVADVLKLLATVSCKEDNVTTERSRIVQPLLQSSTRFSKLAREYDLLAASFFGTEFARETAILAHALSCSVLAFVTGFSLSPCRRSLENSFRAVLIRDLAARVWHLDHETGKELLLLMRKMCCSQSKSCYVPRSRMQTLEITYEVRSIVDICRRAVEGVVGGQIAANGVEDGGSGGEIPLQITKDGVELILDTVMSSLNVSMRTPARFFHLRPPVSCQLFATNRDSGNRETISVPPGFHLHLDLCLALRGIPQHARTRLAKLYCILRCKTSFPLSQDSNGQSPSEFQRFVDLNERLVAHVGGCGRSEVSTKGTAETFVCFRPNGNGQGFGTCMLDVSTFPVGCYEIEWHAGCVDVHGSYRSLPHVDSGLALSVQDS